MFQAETVSWSIAIVVSCFRVSIGISAGLDRASAAAIDAETFWRTCEWASHDGLWINEKLFVGQLDSKKVSYWYSKLPTS